MNTRRLRRSSAAMTALTGTAMALAMATPAAAANWNFSFTLSDGESAAGTLVTQSTPAGGPYLVTSLSGLIDGYAMALLPPQGTFNSNLVYTSPPELDSAGLGFTAEGYQWAIWSQSGITVDSWCNNAVDGLDHQCNFADDPNGTVTAFSLSQTSVPEPASWALVTIGMLALGGALRSQRRPATAPI